MNALEISGLTVEIEGKTILKDFSLTLPMGETHALMGPNGAGKSTLSKALAGHPHYKVTGGGVLMDGKPILGLTPDAIAREGLFLSFQYPCEVNGVSIANFLRAAIQARQPKDSTFEATRFYKELYDKMGFLQMDRSFSARSLNEGFSGGEKKRCEILQMLMLAPKYIILDETDSGLDIDALKVVAQGVNAFRGPNTAFLIITHYQRLLNYIVPDKVHVMQEGKIVRTGGKEVALELEEKGYEKQV